MREADYPYTAKDGDCQYDRSKGIGSVFLYQNVEGMSQKELQSALMKGPVSVAIQAD